MHAEWIQRANSETDTWTFEVDKRNIYGYISNYAGTEKYNWQAVRDFKTLSGIVIGREASMVKAEEALALPIEDFIEAIAAELREELYERERKLFALQPCSKYLPGYHVGYEAGAADVKRRIEEVMSDSLVRLLESVVMDDLAKHFFLDDRGY